VSERREQEVERGGRVTGVERMGVWDIRVPSWWFGLSADGSGWYFDHVRTVVIRLMR
jgi:hypothetical protein